MCLAMLLAVARWWARPLPPTDPRYTEGGEASGADG